MNKKISEMFALQNKLNIATNGAQWLDGITKEEKVINWDRAIHLECAELIESYPWKHWKSISQQPDIGNAKIEAVDIWHFLMSSILEVKHLLNKNQEAFFDKEMEVIFNDENFLQSLSDVSTKDGFCVAFSGNIEEAFEEMNSEWTLDQHKKIDSFIDPFEKLEELALFSNRLKKLLKDKDLNVNEEIRYKTPLFDLTFKQSGTKELDEKAITIFYAIYTFQFFIVAKLTGLDLEELYRIYLGKNLLNQFRQNYGYKEGTYIKVWNGKEDNVVMMEVIEEHSEGTYEEIYDKIEVIYKNL